jgi:hypothetical protein
VQPEFDGIISAYDPAADERDAAERILAAVEEPLLYARMDLVRGLDGTPQLIELELIEPDLYLGYDEKAGARFAAAVKAAIEKFAPLPRKAGEGLPANRAGYGAVLTLRSEGVSVTSRTQKGELGS